MLYFNSNSVRSIIGAATLCIACGSQAASITPLDFYADLISGDGNVVAGHTRTAVYAFQQLTVYQNGQTTVVSQAPSPIDISTNGTTILAGTLPFPQSTQRVGSDIYKDGELTSFRSNPLVERPEAFIPLGISPDGNTLVGDYIPNVGVFPFSVQAATYSNDQVQIVGPEGSSGRDIAANGAVVGSSDNGSKTGLFNEEGFSEFAFEGSDLTTGQAFDISKDGSTAVGYFLDSSFLLSLYVHRDGLASPLANSESSSDFPVDFFYRSIGISGDGSTIVSHKFQLRDDFSLETVSLFWELDEDGNYIATSLIDRLLMLGLDISAEGWSSLQANDISDDGRYIIGHGTQSDNPDTLGFIIDLHPVPLPAAAWLFASAFIGLVGFKKAKRSTTNNG